MFRVHSLQNLSTNLLQSESSIFFVRTPEFPRTLHLKMDSILTQSNGFDLLGITNAFFLIDLVSNVSEIKSSALSVYAGPGLMWSHAAVENNDDLTHISRHHVIG